MHVLDLASREDFPQILNGLIENSGATVGADHVHQPKGRGDQDKTNEMQLRQFLRLCHFKTLDQKKATNDLDTWWLKVRPHTAKTPQWDLLCECSMNDKDGIVLVEAKAHEGELDWGGKQLEPDASRGSCLNHKRIGKAIEEACRSLDAKKPGVNISRDSHYQLANRVAYAWKLANMGLHVVLLYLGLIGDTRMSFVGQPLEDHDHWVQVMGGYTIGVLPHSLPNTRFEFPGGGSMMMLIRSRKVLRLSPALHE